MLHLLIELSEDLKMNKLKGQIIAIESSDQLSLVDIQVGEDMFCAIVIDTKQSTSYLQIGNTINLLFKETEIFLKSYHQKKIKGCNKFVASIKNLRAAPILTEIKLDYNHQEITAIILSRSIHKHNYTKDEQVVVILRAHEIMLQNE